MLVLLPFTSSKYTATVYTPLSDGKESSAVKPVAVPSPAGTVTVLPLTSSPFESSSFIFVAPRMSKLVPVTATLTFVALPSLSLSGVSSILLTFAGAETIKEAVTFAGVALLTIAFTVYVVPLSVGDVGFGAWTVAVALLFGASIVAVTGG